MLLAGRCSYVILGMILQEPLTGTIYSALKPIANPNSLPLLGEASLIPPERRTSV